MYHKRLGNVTRDDFFIEHLNVQFFAYNGFQRQLDRVAADVVCATNVAVCDEAFRIAQPFKGQEFQCRGTCQGLICFSSQMNNPGQTNF